jgi:flagellar basal-body rod modification protein FlgD
MVDAVGANQALGASSLTQALGGSDSLDRDAFLKLLVAQLKNQDPLEPKENSEFVAELAQFSSLEQTMGINERLDLLSIQQRGLANTEAVSLVGQKATVRGNVATLDGSGAAVPVAYSLAGPVESVTITIADSTGKVIRTLERGASSGGFKQLSWDGRSDVGVMQPAGRYTIAVKAFGPNESVVSATQQVSGEVKAVAFDKGYPEITLDNGIAVPVADLLRVEPGAK